MLALVCAVIFIDSVGYGVVVPVLPQYAKQLHVGDFSIGFLFATYAIALLAASIPMGILSDRWGRKPFVLFGMFAMAGAFVFYAFAKSYPMLVIARVLDGLTAAATWSAGLALLGDRFEEREMGSKIGWAIAAMAIGGIAGPLLGGTLADSIGYRAPFYAIAIACLGGGMAALFLVEDRSGLRSRSLGWRMLRPVFTNRNVLLACLITLVTTTGLGLLEPTLPIYLRNTFDMSRTAIGIVFGVTMLLYAIASPVAGKLSDQVGRKRPIIGGLPDNRRPPCHRRRHTALSGLQERRGRVRADGGPRGIADVLRDAVRSSDNRLPAPLRTARRGQPVRRGVRVVELLLEPGVRTRAHYRWSADGVAGIAGGIARLLCHACGAHHRGRRTDARESRGGQRRYFSLNSRVTMLSRSSRRASTSSSMSSGTPP